MHMKCALLLFAIVQTPGAVLHCVFLFQGVRCVRFVDVALLEQELLFVHLKAETRRSYTSRRRTAGLRSLVEE